MKKHFQAMLEHDQTALRWVVARVPFDPAIVWPERKGLRVKGTIAAAKASAKTASLPASCAIRTSLFRTPEGGYVLLVNKQMQKAASVTVGGMVDVELEPDLEERATTVPAELAKLLKGDRSLKRFYEEFSPSMRRDIAEHIHEPKSAEARVRRAEELAERMMLAMEGEEEAPPILQIAFRKQPEARAGWEAMTAVQRRGHLMGIFAYKSPESRAKRAQKAIDEALRVAKKTR